MIDVRLRRTDADAAVLRAQTARTRLMRAKERMAARQVDAQWRAARLQRQDRGPAGAHPAPRSAAPGVADVRDRRDSLRAATAHVLEGSHRLVATTSELIETSRQIGARRRGAVDARPGGAEAPVDDRAAD
jgi:hypothetical protein